MTHEICKTLPALLIHSFTPILSATTTDVHTAPVMEHVQPALNFEIPLSLSAIPHANEEHSNLL